MSLSPPPPPPSEKPEKKPEQKQERARARRPEVLAPAGDAASLKAALAAGADAVYFGLDAGFNARARAANFSSEGLDETVALVHRAGARVYLTLNTLVFERELPLVEDIVRRVAAAGADAIIVQDPAVALLARAVCPALEVHASTQMTVSSPEGAAFARGLGVTRVVVPRELSVDEIRRFAAGTDLELEVFIHGALCVSWSGQCLTSEAWGGRSANRGQCAQSCRMPYDLVVDGEARDLGDVKYLLSPRDLAGAQAARALVDIGVHGLKIEGRQKGPEYVATAVAGYRRYVDAIIGGIEGVDEQTGDNDIAPALAADLRRMALAYTRGFSDGFLGGVDHQTLVDGRFPKHRGIYLGRVQGVAGNKVTVAREPPAAASSGPHVEPVTLRPGMGVVFDEGRPETEEPGGAVWTVDERSGGGSAIVVLGFGPSLRAQREGGPREAAGRPGPDLSRVRPGQRVWVTSDPAIAREAERLVAGPEPEGRIALELAITGAAGAPLRVTARVVPRSPLPPGATPPTATVESEARLSPAAGAGLDRALLAAKLGALGGTPFFLDGEDALPLAAEEPTASRGWPSRFAPKEGPRAARARKALDTSGLAPGLHLPVSELKRLRRALAVALLPQVERGPARAVADTPQLPRLVAGAPEPIGGPLALRAQGGARAAVSTPELPPPPAPRPALIPLVRTDAQLAAVIAMGRAALPEVELDWMELVGLGRAALRARDAGLRVTIATPRVQKPGEEGYDARIARLAPDGVLVRHWGALMHFAALAARRETRPSLHGDFSLNVTNSLTARHLLDLGLDTLTAAHDLDQGQLLALLDAAPAPRFTVVVHHHIPTFHTEHCVYSHLLSNGRDHRTCGRPCERHEVALRDHTGLVHPVIVDVGCRNTVFNAQAQSAASLVPRLAERGVARLRVEFVRENQGEAERVLAAWLDLLAERISPAELVRRVGVHEQFGVTRGTMRVLG